MSGEAGMRRAFQIQSQLFEPANLHVHVSIAVDEMKDIDN
jgi:hypothetical protein